jgi:LysR family transcriptional regulator for metE and metH
MQIEIRHLRLVDAVTAEGSLTRAAERLHVTQSALSHSLREIEERLRTPLFHRVNGRLVLSAAGERLRASAQRILAELRLAVDDIARLASHQDGVVRISTECYTSYQWLPALLKAFQLRFPSVDVEIVAEATRRPVEALTANEIDVALVYDKVRDRRLRLTPLFTDEIVVVAATDHALTKKRVIVPADLAGEHVILHAQPADSYFASRLIAAGITPRRYSQVILTEAIVEMVRAGLGVAALPQWTVARELKHGSLAAVRFTSRGLMRRWSAATLRTAATPAPIAHFIELVKGRWASPVSG